MSHRFSFGIDLGTTNSAIAVTDLANDRTEVVDVTQVLTATQIGEKPTLPSAIYIPHPAEFPDDAFRLPWESEGGEAAIVGQFARDHGALVPDRLVTSAKSWLSNPHIDARQNVLPWNSDMAEPKLSPLECSRRYLRHLKEGFLYAERSKGREWNLSDGVIVLAVPASFDEVARSLTAEAAEAAGLGAVILLEEPQAAFYAWISQAAKGWRTQVAPGDIVLVCDVGGGTADFSLIAVTETDGVLALERISVGEHILLGGDNMDLALAYTLKAQLEADGKNSVDSWQLLALVHAAARAKLTLFADPLLPEVPITVPSRGSSLFARAISTPLQRASLERVVLDGFFPLTGLTDLPQESRTVGLREFGLPYAADPAVSKHLARFLVRSLANVRASESLTRLVGARAESQTLLAPTAVLFNGGVFNAAPIRGRVKDVLTSWTHGAVRELEGAQLDLAVAKGASLYGRNRATGKGLRIKAGTARSYYIGLETSMPAVPGFQPPVKALCVVPQGMEEGSELLIAGREFGLVTGHPADFRFFSSEARSGDKPGQILPDAERELEETGVLEVDLPSVDGFPEGQAVPVEINSVVTELGTLELWMQHTNSDRRWKVEFAVRTE
jgi:Hsp70 protein